MTMSVFNQVMIQTFYYAIVLILTLFFVGAFQRGFFVTYFKVRTSFGRLVMVKVRSPLRDYFRPGWVEEGFLMYKVKQGFRDYSTIRLNIPKDTQPFYKCMSVMWVDVDDEKHAIAKTNYDAVPGYDAILNDNLHKRALMRPSIASGQEKLILVLIVVVGIIALAGVYLAYSNYAQLRELATLPQVVANLKGTVVGGPAF